MDRQKNKREAKREFWRNVLADWASSGMSKSEYARLHGLEIRTLRWWSSQHPEWARRSAGDESDAQEPATPSASAAAPSFLTIPPLDARGNGNVEPLRLTLGGATLEIPPGFCEQTLDRVLGVLERRR